MANKKISELPAATAPDGSELMEIVQGGINKRLTLDDLPGGASAADDVDNEVPSGTINGSNTAFTLANTPISGSVKIYLNGIRFKGGGVDYSISGTTVTFVTAPATGDSILADYRK